MVVKIKRHQLMRYSSPKNVLHILKFLWWYLLPIILFSLIFVAKQFPRVVETVYSRSLYPVIAYTYGWIISLIPISLLEICILLIILTVLVFCLHGITLWMKREPITCDVWKGLLWLSRGICLVLSMFMLFCGYNYYRLPFAETSGLIVRDSSVQELFDLCLELSSKANLLRTQLPIDENYVMQLSQGAFELSGQARDTFAGLATDYPTLPAYPITPKPVINSWAMSLMQITGVFCPITFEANINHSAPDYTVPATMCHELAHSRGFMREDEANFIGYLACVESDKAEFQYSGVMLGLAHAGNRLYGVDKESFQIYFKTISDEVLRDLIYNNDYWARFEGPVGDISTAVNNTYLQLNSQVDGVHSYGRMVDLLLADYRSRHDEFLKF